MFINYECQSILQIESYILDKEKCSALILLGGPGSGKSSLLARVADVACLRAAKGEIPRYIPLGSLLVLFDKWDKWVTATVKVWLK